MSDLKRSDRRFFACMSLAIVAAVFVGFAPTYYLKGYFQSPPLPPLIHAHGVLFTAWIVLFVTQAALVARGRLPLHRRLGWLGAALAGAMIAIGLAAAIVTAGRSYAAGDTGVLGFLVMPFGDLFVFAVLVAAGLWYRRRGEVHKRLMLLATVSLLGAAVARWPFAALQAPVGFFAVIDLFIAAGVVHDLWSRRRVHPAFVAGGLLVVASQPLRLLLAETEVWLTLAAAILR